MIHTIKENTFTLIDVVKVRHAQQLMILSKKLDAWEIDEIAMAVETISLMLISINDITDKTKFKDFIFDELEPSEMTELSEKAMETINGFVKKNENLSTNTQHS